MGLLLFWISRLMAGALLVELFMVWGLGLGVWGLGLGVWGLGLGVWGLRFRVCSRVGGMCAELRPGCGM